MEYKAAGSYWARDEEPSFKTLDGVVSETSAPYKWALGKRVEAVLHWCRQKRMNVHARADALCKWKRLE